MSTINLSLIDDQLLVDRDPLLWGEDVFYVAEQWVVGDVGIRVCGDRGIRVFQGTVTGPKHGLMGPVRNLAFRKVLSSIGSKRFTWFTAAVKADDLAFLAGLLESGQVVPVIERCYPLEQVQDALRYLAEGHALGKLVITT